MSVASIRLFVTGPLNPGAEFALPEAQSHYLATVLRAAVDARLRIFDGVSGEFTARITALARKSVRLAVESQTRPQEPAPDCWLCFALLKRTRTDLVVEKATELGVSVIQPIITARTQAERVNLERLASIATEAAEQCERLNVPHIRPPAPLARLMADWPADRPLFVADERRTAGLLGPARGPSALMVGPEGGFTDVELEAIARTPQVTRVSLGHRILRAETASIAGLALHLAAWP